MQTRVQEGTVHLQTGQKQLEENYKYPDMMPKVDKVDMAGMLKANKEYLQLHHHVTPAPIA